uniref:Uncharacterized protein n=1 Tax=Arundo donax TaxID=35708 RepID=A0A0A9HSA5_ARUDO
MRIGKLGIVLLRN